MTYYLTKGNCVATWGRTTRPGKRGQQSDGHPIVIHGGRRYDRNREAETYGKVWYILWGWREEEEEKREREKVSNYDT